MHPEASVPPGSLRVLVAGATGYLGRFLVQALGRRGHRAIALVRHPDALARPGHHGAPIAVAPAVRVADATDPVSLRGTCDGVDAVFSAVGLTRQQGRLTFEDVDYGANHNLLDEAARAGVAHFGVVAIVGGPAWRHLEVVDCKERFVDELRASRTPSSVVRSTGFFSDMAELFAMARRGRILLFGDGRNRTNPVHGADVAEACVDALEQRLPEMLVGGPQTFSMQQIAELAASTGGPARIHHLPLGLVRPALSLVRLFSRHTADLAGFITTVMSRDVLAPERGSRLLADYFRELADGQGGR